MTGSLVLASAVLWLAGLAPALIFAFALLQGASHGMMSILKPLLVSESLGQAGYGVMAGALASGALLGMAAAPFAGAVLLEWGGADLLIGVTLAMALAALACALVLLRRHLG